MYLGAPPTLAKALEAAKEALESGDFKTKLTPKSAV
jgi:hypothetical protein